MPKRKSSWTTPLRVLFIGLLYPLSWIFGGAVWLRNRFFDWGWFSVKRLSRPVISVGNIAMGGTGKSPMTMALVALLQDQGFKVAVLSRGYGRRQPQRSLRVTVATDFRDGGDEPVMMARRFPNTLIGVGPSRWEAAAILGQEPDFYVVDDGFQHRQLHRDIDVVLLNIRQPEPRLFPLGRFREGWRGLRRADAVVLTRWQPGCDDGHWRQKIARENAKAAVFTCGFEAKALCSPDGKPLGRLEDLRGMKVAAYAGIAQPEPFFESLQLLGATLVATRVLPDHGNFEELQRKQWFLEAADRGAQMVVTTEKDAVKLDNHAGFGIVVAFLSTGVAWFDQVKFLKIIKQFAPQKDSEWPSSY